MNNAGIGATTIGTSWEGLDAWHKIFDVNLFGYACGFGFWALSLIGCDKRRVLNVQHAFVPVRFAFVYAIAVSWLES